MCSTIEFDASVLILLSIPYAPDDASLSGCLVDALDRKMMINDASGKLMLFVVWHYVCYFVYCYILCVVLFLA